jgi:hypothetical protein
MLDAVPNDFFYGGGYGDADPGCCIRPGNNTGHLACLPANGIDAPSMSHKRHQCSIDAVQGSNPDGKAGAHYRYLWRNPMNGGRTLRLWVLAPIQALDSTILGISGQ